MSYALEVKNLTYAYSKGMPDEKVAVNDISVAVNKGEFVGIIGHTGSGKSTFVQHLNGLLKPTSGQILVNGQDIWQNKDKLQELRFAVGLVFQYPEYQLFEETIYKDIAFGPKNMKLSDDEIHERVVSAASYVGIGEDLFEMSPFDLSGGQKRRVAIAGVLAMEPEILVLDEPTAGLDPAGRAEILDEIQRYHKEKGNTVIIVSHSMDDIAKYAEKVIVINEGSLFCYDEAAKVFEMSDELEKMGLAIPTVTSIMLKLKEKGFDLDTGVYTVKDAAKVLVAALAKGGGKHA